MLVLVIRILIEKQIGSLHNYCKENGIIMFLNKKSIYLKTLTENE